MNTSRLITVDLEIPKPEDSPTTVDKFPGDLCIALPIAIDLFVPELPRLSPVVVRVAMPKGSIYKDCYASSDPRKVRLTDNLPWMETPTPKPSRPHRSPKSDLRSGVPGLDPGHQGTSAGASQGIRQGL
jgi:hypothetical protein